MPNELVFAVEFDATPLLDIEGVSHSMAKSNNQTDYLGILLEETVAHLYHVNNSISKLENVAEELQLAHNLDYQINEGREKTSSLNCSLILIFFCSTLLSRLFCCRRQQLESW